MIPTEEKVATKTNPQSLDCSHTVYAAVESFLRRAQPQPDYAQHSTGTPDELAKSSNL